MWPIDSCSHLGKSRLTGVAATFFFIGGGLGATTGVTIGILLGMVAVAGLAGACEGVGTLAGVLADDEPADEGPEGIGTVGGVALPPCSFARRFRRI